VRPGDHEMRPDLRFQTQIQPPTIRSTFLGSFINLYIC
jgi:hypothetical protein